MQVKTKIIVLRVVKYNDRKFISDVFSDALGRVSLVVNVSSKGQGGKNRQLFRPLSILDVVINYVEHKDLQKVSESSYAFPQMMIMEDVRKISIMMFLSEFLSTVVQAHGGEDCRQVYAYIETSLLWLAEAREGFSNFHLVFTLKFLPFLGFDVQESVGDVSDFDESNVVYDMRNAVFIVGQPLHGDTIPNDDAVKIKKLMRMSLSNMRLFQMTRVERNRCLDYILRFYSIHLVRFPQLKSLDVVREIFD